MAWGGGFMTFVLGLSSTYRSRTPFATCSGTSSPLFDRTSAHVLREDASVLGGGATGTSLSSDHSDIAALHVRAVWSPPSEMPLGLRGATSAIFLFF